MRTSEPKTSPPTTPPLAEGPEGLSDASAAHPLSWNPRIGLRTKALILVLLLVLISMGTLAGVSWQLTSETVSPLTQRHADQSGLHLAQASRLAFLHDDLPSLESLTIQWLDDPSLAFAAIYDAEERLLASAIRDQSAWEGARRHAAQTSQSDDGAPVSPSGPLLRRLPIVLADLSAHDTPTPSVDSPSLGGPDEVLEENGRPSDPRPAEEHLNEGRTAADPVEVDPGGRVVGYAVVGISRQATLEAQKRHRSIILGMIFASMVISLLLIVPTVGRWSARLERLVQASQRFSKGELTEGVRAVGTDEIGLLAEAHEAMRLKIQKREEELRQLNASLQQRVIERTRDLAEAKDVAETANRAKNLLLTNMSHEIRTPMNGILGVAELLLRGAKDNHQRKLSESIHTSARSLLQVIQDILDFSRIESGQMTMDLGPVDAPAIAEQVIQELAARARDKGSTLTFHVHSSAATQPVESRSDAPETLPEEVSPSPGEAPNGVDPNGADPAEDAQTAAVPRGAGDGREAPRFTSDRHRIRQVLTAVVTNAIKLTRDGELELHLQDIAETSRRGIVFRMLDRRHGISNDSFALPDASGAMWPVGSGSRETLGLGLAIAYHLSRALGGHLSFNDSSHGTVLEVWLPSIDTASAMEAPSPFSTGAVRTTPIPRFELPDSDADIRSTPQQDIATQDLATVPKAVQARILVAEDNRVNRMVVLGHLRALGYHAQAVENGQQAVDLLAEEPFDLVLMDCQMPVMDGYEATQALRRRETDGERLPIVAVTAHAMRGDRERCLQAGMDDYLAKPFRSEQLITTLNRWLPQSQVKASSFTPSAADTPSISPSDETPQLDLKPLQDLIDLGQTMQQDVLGRVVGVFTDETPEFLAELRRAATNRDTAALRETAHAIKGSAANIGAPRLANQAEGIETLAAQGADVDWQSLLATLEDEFEQVAAALNRRVERNRHAARLEQEATVTHREAN